MAQISIEQAIQIAIQHHQAGRLGEAESIYRQILAVRPNHPDALNLLGVIAGEAGKADAAIDLFRRAIASLATESMYHCNLGKALMDKGSLEEAIGSYRRAIELNPTLATAYNSLASAFTMRGQFEEAVAHFQKALQLEPNSPETLNNYGNVLKDSGQLDDAIAAYRKALAINPDFFQARSNLVYSLHFHPGFDDAALHEEHARWNQRHGIPLKKLIRPHDNDRSPERRLRIGYVSADFRHHPIGRFMLPLLAAHDRKQVEVFCFSDFPGRDILTDVLRPRADQWRQTSGMSDEALAELIRREKIDLLIDLNMHMSGSRLFTFARKPAPVQVTYLAYCSTTGLDAIDYRLSDPYLDPPGFDTSMYSEKTVRLPETYWCYEAMCEEPLHGVPAVARGHITFGCLNNFCKVTQPVLETWARLLQSVPGSRLMLHAREGSHRRRVYEFLASRGISAERCTFTGFLPFVEYFQQYQAIDIVLDTFPYAGGTTTCDALWMGAPVVTLAGGTAVGRGGVSILSNIGLAELIAQTSEEYLQIARTLAGDLPRLQELRTSLRGRMQGSPLMNARRFARHMEAAYRQMWRDWCTAPASM